MRVNFAPTLSIPILIRFTSFVSRISISNAISKLQLGTKSAMPHKTYILIIVPSYIFLYRYEYSPPANCNIKKSAPLTCNNQKGFFFHLAHLTSFILKLCFLPFFYSVQSQFLISKRILYSGLFQCLTLVYFIFKLIIQNSVQIGPTLFSFCK